jgi:hypothetical protein
MDESTGNLLPVVPPTLPSRLVKLGSIYFLRSLSCNDQRARVGSVARSEHLFPSEPANLSRKKLKEKVERRRLKRQEEAEKAQPRRAMSTLHALMLNGNKQAQTEYFQRREEEEQAKRPAAKREQLVER